MRRLPPLLARGENWGAIERLTIVGRASNVKRNVAKEFRYLSLVHSAAHGEAERREIACAPNPSSSQVSRKEVFLLTMEDIVNVGIRAELVKHVQYTGFFRGD